jgi:hypothetical protein
MFRTIILLSVALSALGQITPIDPNSPVANGPTIINANFTYLQNSKVAIWSGSGVPGSIPMSVLGDLYVNTASNVTYQCYKVTACTAVGVGNWAQISGTVAGGNCTNQVVTGISTTATPTCTTVTSAYVNTSIALTGTDINTSNQVTATHLASPLPILQGGTGSASPSLVAGAGIGISGSWPNQTVAAAITVTSITGAELVTITSSSGSAYVGATTNAAAAIGNGQHYYFIPGTGSSTTAPTLAVNGFAAKTIVHSDGSALASTGELSATGWCDVLYDLGSDTFQLQNGNCSTGPGFGKWTCIAASSVPNAAASGILNIFCDSSNSNHLSTKSAGGTVIDLQAGSAGGTRSFSLPVMGGNGNALGFVGYGVWDAVAGTVTAGTGSSSNYAMIYLANSGTDPAIQAIFPIPQDFASGLKVSVAINDASAAGGSIQLNYALSCWSSGSAPPTPSTNTANTGVVAVSTVLITTATTLGETGCSAGSFAGLRITRNNTAPGGSNMAGVLGLAAVRIDYTSSY